MRLVGFLCVAIFGSAFQCNTTPSVDPEGSEGIASCVKNKEWFISILDGLKNNADIKSEVIRYTYHGQTVYYIDSCKGCADSMALVYTCSGEVICQFGGIAGFNTCPDFADFAIDKKVIWQN